MMKKIFLLLLLAVMVFTACDPIEDRDNIGTALTVDQLEATVTVKQENGKNVNYVYCECSSPVSSQWDNGIAPVQSSYAELLIFGTGQQKVTLRALCADGTLLTKEFTFTVDEMSPNHPLPVEYRYFTGNSEKVWVWDNLAPDGAPYGNGGYMGNIGPGWWKVPMSDLDAQSVEKGCPGDGKDAYMTFKLSGMQIVKSSGAQGSFSFSMSEIVSSGWDIGTMYTSGVNVLIGVNGNAIDVPYYQYSILKLDDDVLWLAAPEPGAGSWGACWFWCFRSQGSSQQ